MMLSAKRRGKDKRSDGFIIVAVLWILGALATLAVVYALYVKQAGLTVVDSDERIQADALATAGVELAVYRLTAIPSRRPAKGQFSFQQGSATVSVEFSSENSRIDLNFATKELLAGLFISLGAPRDDALSFADRIIAWRTPLNPGATHSEAGIYQAAGKAYGPRHGPFQNVDELALLVGLPPWLIDRALPYLTVYTGHRLINVISAPPEVLAALPGVTPDLLRMLLAQRGGTPVDVLRAQLGAAGNYITMRPSAADRIDVDVGFRTNRRIRSEAVVFILDKDTEPYRILSWRDEEPAND
jgi:general secretion pathway protein K